MTELLFFILGMITYAVIIPILESLVVLIQSCMEYPKGRLALKITQINDELAEEQERQSKQQSFAIGFQAPSTEYYEEEDDD